MQDNLRLWRHFDCRRFILLSRKAMGQPSKQQPWGQDNLLGFETSLKNKLRTQPKSVCWQQKKVTSDYLISPWIIWDYEPYLRLIGKTLTVLYFLLHKLEMTNTGSVTTGKKNTWSNPSQMLVPDTTACKEVGSALLHVTNIPNTCQDASSTFTRKSTGSQIYRQECPRVL